MKSNINFFIFFGKEEEEIGKRLSCVRFQIGFGITFNFDIKLK